MAGEVMVTNPSDFPVFICLSLSAGARLSWDSLSLSPTIRVDEVILG